LDTYSTLTRRDFVSNQEAARLAPASAVCANDSRAESLIKAVLEAAPDSLPIFSGFVEARGSVETFSPGQRQGANGSPGKTALIPICQDGRADGKVDPTLPLVVTRSEVSESGRWSSARYGYDFYRKHWVIIASTASSRLGPEGRKVYTFPDQSSADNNGTSWRDVTRSMIIDTRTREAYLHEGENNYPKMATLNQSALLAPATTSR